MSSREGQDHVRWLRFMLFLIVTLILGVVQLVNMTPTLGVENGDIVEPAPWWAVHLSRTTPNGPVTCTGSLVASEWILTAGHCVTEVLNEVPLPADDPLPGEAPTSSRLYYSKHPLSSFRIAVGRADLRDSSAGVERSVSEIFLHNDFRILGELQDEQFQCTILFPTRMCSAPKRNTSGKVDPVIYRYDMALIKLSSPVPQNYVPISLASSNPLPGTDSFLQGYGATTEEGNPSRVLNRTKSGSYQVISCPLRIDNVCFSQLDENLSRVQDGDSGGPWLVSVGGSSLVQVGVHGTGNESSAGAASIATSLIWIRSIANISTPPPTSIGSLVPIPTGTDPGGPYISPTGSTLVALNANGTVAGALTSLLSVSLSGAIEWRRDDFLGAIVDVSFSPSGEPIVVNIGQQQGNGGPDPTLFVLSTTGSILRSATLPLFPYDVEYGGDGLIYVHSFHNISVLESYQFGSLQRVDQVNVRAGRLAARQNALTHIHAAGGSATFFSYNNGSLQQKIERSGNTGLGYRRTSIDPEGNVFGLNGGSYNCNDTKVSFVSPSSTWSRLIVDYLPNLATSCDAVDVEALPSGGAVIAVLFPSQVVKLVIINEAGQLTGTIDRNFSSATELPSSQFSDPQFYEIQVDGAGNIVLAGIGLEPCSFDSAPRACGFLRVETLTPGGSSLNVVERHGNFATSDPNDNSLSLYNRGGIDDEVLGVGTGVTVSSIATGAYYCGFSTCGVSGTTESLAVFPVVGTERRYWEDPPLAKPTVPTTTTTTTLPPTTTTSTSTTTTLPPTTTTTLAPTTTTSTTVANPSLLPPIVQATLCPILSQLRSLAFLRPFIDLVLVRTGCPVR